MVNLSALDGCSVNDGISKDLASLSYVSVDEVATNEARDPAGKYGHTTVLSVHPQDRPLLGMQWEGLTYVIAVL